MLLHRLLQRAAERRPDALAYRWVDRDRSLTYAGAVAAMDDMAGALAELGVKPGERVTIVAHNGLDYLNAMFGIWRLGAVAALVNVKFAHELDYYFADHTPSLVIYTHDIHAEVTAAASASPQLRHLLCMDGPQPGASSLPELMAARLKPPSDPGDESAIAHLSYTSGTTGRPKGACLMHEPTNRAARCIAERLRITDRDVSFGPTALSSSYQLVGNLLPQLDRMAEIHVMGRWTQGAGFDALDACGATMLIANPPLLEEVLAESAKRGRAPGRLRMSLSGGGPVPPSLKTGWRDRLGLPLVESYGQSELGGFFGLGFPELEPDDGKLMRVGPPLPDREVAILTAGDTIAAPGEIGEICATGGFMKGYWGKSEKSAEATRGGWLRSGDAGFLDADGHLTMRGRHSELIEVNGETWYPRDIEEAAARRPGIRLAALVAVRGPSGSPTRPVLFVTTAEGAAIDEGDLREAIAGDLDRDLSPLAVVVRGSLPMTPTGKIAKSDLAREVLPESQDVPGSRALEGVG